MSGSALFAAHPYDVMQDQLHRAAGVSAEQCERHLAEVADQSMKKRLRGGKVTDAEEDFDDEATRMAQFAYWDRQNFRLWPALCDALLATTFRCPRALWKVPYFNFTLHMPRSIGARFPIHHQDGTTYPTNVVWVIAAIDEDGLLQAIRDKAALDSKHLRVGFVCDSGPQGSQMRPVAGNNYRFVLRMDGWEDEAEMLDESRLNDRVIDGRDSDSANEEWRLDLIRLAANAVAYINTPAADVQPRTSDHDRLTKEMSRKPARTQAKKERRAAALSGASRLRHTDTGSRVRLPNLSGGGESDEGSGWKIRHRFIVRGHWKYQACGVGRADRKLRWIHPYYKGTGLPDRKGGRTYEVSTA